MTDWIPSLNALRAYEAAARHLSYTKAAKELNVTPAAVKQLVAKLETMIGANLIYRDGHRLVLTPKGTESLSDMQSAMRHIRESVRKMRASPQNARLIVSVESSIATTWLVPRLEGFREACPGIDVLIDSSQRVVDLEHEDTDIAIRYGVPLEGGLVSTRLFEDMVLPACSPQITDGPVNLKTIEDLRKTTLIHWDMAQMPWAQNTRQWFDWTSWLKHRQVEGVDTTIGPRFSDYGMAVQAAISGQGVLLAGWPALQDPMAAGLLICPFPDQMQTTDIGFDVVTTRDAAARDDVASFTSWLVQTAAESSSALISSISR